MVLTSARGTFPKLCLSAHPSASQPRGRRLLQSLVLQLLGQDWDGLLVVSSADPARFEASMGTEILSFLCEVLTIVLTPRVAALNPA
jgi:uncharacterized protein YigA (DUF484 family)